MEKLGIQGPKHSELSMIKSWMGGNILGIAEYLKIHPPTIRGYGKIYVDIQQRWTCIQTSQTWAQVQFFIGLSDPILTTKKSSSQVVGDDYCQLVGGRD